MMPLSPEGEAVARHFIRTEAFWRPPTPKPGKTPRQTWSCPSAYKRIVEAARRVEEAPFNVYAIKHSFASALRRTGTELEVIKDMLGHTDLSSTRIYAPTVHAKHVEALERLRAGDARRYDGVAPTVPVAPGSGTGANADRDTAEVA